MTVHIVEKYPPIAYGSRQLGEAFEPPIGEQAVRDAIKRGALPSHQVGRTKYVLRDDAIAWIKAH